MAVSGYVDGNACFAAASAYSWDMAEVAYIFENESEANPYSLNLEGSGACGCFQTLPCVGHGDAAANAAEAWRKYSACNGGSFYCDWYRWWG